MQELTVVLERTLSNPRWSDDGMIYVPIKNGQVPQNPFSIDCVDSNSDDGGGGGRLAFTWPPKTHVSMLGWFLCGVAMSHTSMPDLRLAEHYLEQALQLTQSEPGGEADT